MNRLNIVLFTALTVVMSLQAGAAVISYNASIPFSTTNWAQALAIQQFDPALGTLTSVAFTLTGKLEGAARFENLDAAPGQVVMNLSALIVLKAPDDSILASSAPSQSTSDSVTAFDGTEDFSGTSGKTYLALTDSVTVSNIINSGLDPYIGVGTINLPIMATGSASGAGPGNLVLQFDMKAGADILVEYTYEPIPEPSGLLAFGFGVAAFAGAIFRMKK